MTQKQKEIIKLFAQGFNGHEIAGMRHVKLTTIRWHVREVLEKGNYKNIIHAVCMN